MNKIDGVEVFAGGSRRSCGKRLQVERMIEAMKGAHNAGKVLCLFKCSETIIVNLETGERVTEPTKEPHELRGLNPLGYYTERTYEDSNADRTDESTAKDH